MTGAECAQLFYDESKFKRSGAIPKRIKKTLTGKNAIHTLDDESHKKRKEVFMSVMTPESILKFKKLTYKYWTEYVQKWEGQKKVNIFEETREIMCRAACAWSGIPLKESQVKQVADDFIAIVEAFGGICPRHSRGKKARTRIEAWLSDIMNQVHQGQIEVEKGTPLELMAFFEDHNNEILEAKVAGEDLMNFVRPTTAIAYYITFMAHAQYTNPETRLKLQKDEEGYKECFVQEVRRFYPFAPFMGALVREDFEWKNYYFPKDALVFLDLHGTNHDRRYWERPYEFYPENFKNWDKSPFDFMPHGGGDFDGHRCPGEWITIEAMKVALDFFTKEIKYEVPAQDFTYSLKRMPSFPKSGMVITKVKRI
jgi:fatty-acid peroxygenase